MYEKIIEIHINKQKVAKKRGFRYQHTEIALRVRLLHSHEYILA